MAKRNKWLPEDEPQEEQGIVEIQDDNGVLATEVLVVDKKIAVWQPDPDAPVHAVSFPLPRGVLVALLDSEHELADVAGAEALGLLSTDGLTTIGAIVRAGIVDETAIRHKMAAAWRAQHNTGISGVNRIK